MAGPTRASNNSPAALRATLRVVRFIRRTPSCSSMSRSRWLRLETETPCSSAARRKFRVRATATKASRWRRSKSFIVRQCEQVVQDCPAYRDNRSGPYQGDRMRRDRPTEGEASGTIENWAPLEPTTEFEIHAEGLDQ